MLKSRIARNAGWVLAGQGLGFLLQAAYFIILARLLGAFEYGVYGGAYALSSLFAPYSSLGTGTVFLRYVSGDRSKLGPYWGNLLVVTVIAGSAFTALVYYVGPHLLNPKSAALVLMAALSNCLFAQLTSETARVFQALDNLRTYAALSLLTNLMRTAMAIGMLLILHRATAWQWSIASTIISGLAAMIAVCAVSFSLKSPQWSVRLFLLHGAEGVGYSFASSTTTVYNDFDKTLLSHYGMNIANGIYTTAYRVIDIATMPINSIQGAAVPELFRRGRDGLRATMDLTNRLVRRGVPLGAGIAVILFLTAPILPHMLGKQFSESALALRWLCLIPLFRSVHQLTGAALTGAGLQKYRTAAQVIVSIFNCGINVWLIPRYSWRGAAWSSLATDGLLAILNWGALQLLLRSDKKARILPLAARGASS